MFATSGTIQGNVVIADNSLAEYDGRKVIITVLKEGQIESVADEKLFALSDSLIQQNIEAYRELAK